MVSILIFHSLTTHTYMMLFSYNIYRSYNKYVESTKYERTYLTRLRMIIEIILFCNYYIQQTISKCLLILYDSIIFFLTAQSRYTRQNYYTKILSLIYSMRYFLVGTHPFPLYYQPTTLHLLTVTLITLHLYIFHYLHKKENVLCYCKCPHQIW